LLKFITHVFRIKYLLLIQVEVEQYDLSKKQNLLNIVLKNERQRIFKILNSQKYIPSKNKKRENRQKTVKLNYIILQQF
jgi:hypothetical protein